MGVLLAIFHLVNYAELMVASHIRSISTIKVFCEKQYRRALEDVLKNPEKMYVFLTGYVGMPVAIETVLRSALDKWTPIGAVIGLPALTLGERRSVSIVSRKCIMRSAQSRINTAKEKRRSNLNGAFFVSPLRPLSENRK